jgi:beta-phosphoglucomutase
VIKLIAMDLDGVLVDACEWHYEALNKALLEVASISISRYDHENTYNGLSTKRKLEKLLELNLIKKHHINKIWNAKQKYTMSTINELAKPDWTKIQLHQRIISEGIRICCVTNSIRKTAELMLSKTGQLEYMEFLVTNEDVGLNKPNPHPYYYAVFNANTIMSETLIVEDSPHGLEAAYKSGAHVLPVKNSSEVTTNRVFTKIQEINSKIIGDHDQLFGSNNG